MLDTSKVMLFANLFDLLDGNNADLILETNEALTVDLAVVKGVCGRIDKRRDWTGEGSSALGPTAETRAELASTLT